MNFLLLFLGIGFTAFAVKLLKIAAARVKQNAESDGRLNTSTQSTLLDRLDSMEILIFSVLIMLVGISMLIAVAKVFLNRTCFE